MTDTEPTLCRMGSNMPKPCPFPVTVARPDESGKAEPELCAFHAALIPLTDEVDELNVCLELVRGYLEAVRQEPYLT